MAKKSSVEQAPTDWGAELVAERRDEVVEVVQEALAEAPWNRRFTQKQKSGLVEFHLNMLDFYVWKGTNVWKEGKRAFGRTVVVDPADGVPYSVDIELLGSEWAFTSGPVKVGMMVFNDFLAPWLAEDSLTITSDYPLCEGWSLDAIAECLKAKAGKRAVLSPASGGDAG